MSGRIVWVAAEVVDRATGGGGGIRHVHLLRRLAAEVPVRLVALGPEIDPTVADRVDRLVLVSPARALEDRARRAAGRALAGVSLPEVDALAPFCQQVPRSWLADEQTTTVLCHLATQDLATETRGPVVSHLFHRSSAHLAAEAKRATGVRQARLRRYAHVATRREGAAVDRADLTLVVTEADAAGLPPDRVEVVPNGVDVDVGAGLPTGPPPTPRVLLPGTLFYGPNVDGARWYVDEVWPAVRAEIPAAELVLAGRGPTAEVRALADRPGVAVHADVPDMAAEMAAARVVVVPLRYGTGTRLKALEALAAPRPLVGTTVGLAGLGIEDGVHARVADDAAGLARATVAALADDDTALVERGRALVQDRHTWDAQADRLLTVLADRGLLPPRRGTP